MQKLHARALIIFLVMYKLYMQQYCQKYILHDKMSINAVYILLLVLWDQRTYSERSEKIIGLDPYILNGLSYLDPIKINVIQCRTSLLKLEITLCFFWLLLPVHSGSLKRIDYPNQICLAHTLSFKYSTALKGIHLYIFICCHCSWCCAMWQP